MLVLWGTTPYDGYMGSPLYDFVTGYDVIQGQAPITTTTRPIIGKRGGTRCNAPVNTV